MTVPANYGTEYNMFYLFYQDKITFKKIMV